MPPKKRKLWSWSLFSGGMLSYTLTIFPQPALPPSAQIYAQYLPHGIIATDKEMDSLLQGREQAIQTLQAILGLHPGNALHPDLTLKLSSLLADALLDKSLQAQLSREFPNSLDSLNEEETLLNYRFGRPVTGSVSSLLESLPPVGFSIRINFDFPHPR